MFHELKITARSLARSPVLSATIIAILTVTIGANTAIFSVLEALLLRPLPLHEPERLVRLYESFATPGEDERLATPPLSRTKPMKLVVVQYPMVLAAVLDFMALQT